jgi:iron complex outermembrane recepter protein
MNRTILRNGVAACALVSGLAALPAHAQSQTSEQASEENVGVGEIIVTATRRATDLQKTPVAVSAIDQSIIQQASVPNIGGLAAFVPNFSAETITGFNAASFSMRGVGQNNIIVYFEPPVAVLVDDFVVPSVQTQLLDTFDVSQIEVLRGPQGTLFGKNTTGGAVTVRTKRPVMNSTTADVRVQAGSFGTFTLKGAVNLPLVEDKLSLRIVGGWDKSSGYYRNGGCYGPVVSFVPSKFAGARGCLDGRSIGGKDVASARVKLLFEPSDRVSALFQYEFLRDRSGTVPSVNENYLYTGANPFLTTLLNTGSFQPNNKDPLDNAAITLRNDAFLSDKQRINVDGLYANIDIKFDFGTLTSVTGWRKQTSRLPNSYAGNAPRAADGEPLSIFDASRDDDRKTFQQELRFATQTGGNFDVVAGAFYQKDDTDFCVSQILGFLDLTNGPLPFGNWNNTPYLLCNAQKASSKARADADRWPALHLGEQDLARPAADFHSGAQGRLRYVDQAQSAARRQRLQLSGQCHHREGRCQRADLAGQPRLSGDARHLHLRHGFARLQGWRIQRSDWRVRPVRRRSCRFCASRAGDQAGNCQQLRNRHQDQAVRQQGAVQPHRLPRQVQ